MLTWLYLSGLSAHWHLSPNLHFKMMLTSVCSGKSREVRHLQFLVWPDHGVPMDPSSLLAFILEVRRAHSTASPLVAHCSAGVGRAGTFLAATYLMQLYDQEGTMDVPEGGAFVLAAP
jgi:protein tyrosine phosphatase